MSDTTDLARQLGDALGEGYAVERPLGEGGFAVVFLVRDLALKRKLAVKVLSPDMIASYTVLERFRREAETVAQLSHPNIVPLHFIGQRDDLLYLAMQCVNGGSIADRIEREGRLPVDDVARITSEVASALAYAHRRGVIHRDIKPANILVDGDTGRCLVTDFGIARSAEGSTLTATGLMLGTPAYLAPEQVTGESLDHRVDIFALGVMAYEMLAGRLPYEGNTPTAAMMKRLAGPPEPITTVRPEVPEEIADAIAKCLAADPEERFQNAEDVERAFAGDPVTSAHTVHLAKPKVVRERRARRWLWPAAVGVAAVIVGGAAMWARSRTPAAPMAAADAVDAVDAALITIPAGAYMIGTDVGPAVARPSHTVSLDSFRIERGVVTVAAYAKYADATHAPRPWDGPMPDSGRPVTRVTWSAAADYCRWRYPKGGRLPTELEWEAAARWRGPGGAAVQGATGTVFQWTSSTLRAYPNAPALPDSLANYVVIRGGAYTSPDSVANAWYRGYLSPGAPAADLPYTGFRCVVPVVAAGKAR